jgi:hypothetical protein
MFLSSRYAMFGQSVIVDMQVKEREREKLQAVEVPMEEFLQEVHNTFRSAFALMVS